MAQAKKKKAMLKMRNPAKLAQAARKKTIQSFRDKFYPQYNEASIQQKVKIDQLIMAKYGSKIDKISKKMAMKLKKQEISWAGNTSPLLFLRILNLNGMLQILA